MFDVELPEQAARVASYVRQRIAERHLQPGDRLPSERELCAALDLAHLTVRRGLAALVEEGLIERRVGAGTFVAEASPGRDARSDTVALVIEEDLYAEVIGFCLQGMRAALPAETGIEVVAVSEAGISPEHIARLAQRNIQGVLTQCALSQADRAAISEAGIPFVSLSSVPEPAGTMQVLVDYGYILRRLVAEAYRFGHQQLALVAWQDQRHPGFQVIIEAYGAACRRYKLHRSATTVITHPLPPQPDPSLVDLQSLCKLDPFPSCLVVSDEVMAGAVAQWLDVLDLEIPRDVSLVAVTDATPFVHRIPLTAVDTRTDIRTRYRLATSMLVELMAGRVPSNPQPLHRPDLELRASLGPAPGWRPASPAGTSPASPHRQSPQGVSS